jgi:hypothetical protein
MPGDKKKTSIPTRAVENVLTTKGLQERNAQLLDETTHSGLKRQKSGQKSKNDNHCYILSTIESCIVGIPA